MKQNFYHHGDQFLLVPVEDVQFGEIFRYKNRFFIKHVDDTYSIRLEYTKKWIKGINFANMYTPNDFVAVNLIDLSLCKL